MTYSITQNGKPNIYINNNVVDTHTISVSLFGQDSLNYGQLFDQNFVNLLQNFSNDFAPPTPIVGQLWFDSRNRQLKMYNGVLWDTKYPTFDGRAGNVNFTLNSTAENNIVLTFSDSKIVNVSSYSPVDAVFLPDTIKINDVDYSFKELFPDGLKSGITLASYSNVSVIFSGIASSTSVLTTPRMIEISNAVSSSTLFDGSANINLSVSFNTVYVGNTNVSVAGSHSNVTVDHTGKIINVGNITYNEVIAALGYVPFTSANVSVDAIPNQIVSRDQNGSFAVNVVNGTTTQTRQFFSNVSIATEGALIGVSNVSNGTSNVVVNTQLQTLGNLVPDVYNSITVESNGIVTGGTLVQNMPVGSIILYNNLLVPEGWARCDGNVVITPSNVTVTTPDYSNVLVGGTFYIMKVFNNIDLPSNDPIIGSISVDLVNGTLPLISFIGGPNIQYPPIVWSNVNVASSTSTVNSNIVTKVAEVKKTSSGKQYLAGDRLSIFLPSFSPKFSENAVITVNSVDDKGGILDFTLTQRGSYRVSASTGETGLFIDRTNFSQPTDRTGTQGYSPVGVVEKNSKWLGIPGVTGNIPQGGRSTSQSDQAKFDLVLDTETDKSFFVDDIVLDENLFFDATALVLTNGDPNAVMLSQVNLYGDLSQLTIAQVMKNLENRIFSGLPPRIGKYMLGYDNIVNYSGVLRCPVDKTFFTIALQNRLMYLFVVDHANKFSNDGFYPTDEKLFGAAYIGYTRYLALLKGDKTKTVGEVLEAATLKKTNLNEIDSLNTDVFLQYMAKMITNSKVAVSNNKIAREIAELSNKLNNTNIPVPPPIIPKPLLTTGNTKVVLSEVLIDNIPAIIGGVRSPTPELGGGSYLRNSKDLNDSIYESINSQRFGKDDNDSSSYSYNSGTGGGKGGAPANVNPGNKNTNGASNTVGGYTGGGYTGKPGMSYAPGNGGWVDSYIDSESAGANVWNGNGAKAYKDYYGYAPPDPNTLTAAGIIAEQDKIRTAVAELGTPQASSAVGKTQMVRDSFIAALEAAGVPLSTPGSIALEIANRQTIVNHINDFATAVGKPPDAVTQAEANLSLRYGATGAAALLSAPPGATVRDVINATGITGLLNNQVCTPQGAATPAADVIGYCSDYSDLPSPGASALGSNVPTKSLTDMTAAELLPPATTQATVSAVEVAKQQVVTVVNDIVKLGGVIASAVRDAIDNAIKNSDISPDSIKSSTTVGGTTTNSISSFTSGGSGGYSIGKTSLPDTGPTVTVSKPSGDFSSNSGANLSYGTNVTGGKSAMDGITTSGATLSYGSSVTNSKTTAGTTAEYSLGRTVSDKTSGGTGSATGGGAGNTGGAFGLKGCFVFDTLVDMLDGTVKKIGELRLGDQIRGGEVLAIHCYDGAPLYNYRGVHVSGTHYVIENGTPVMVKDTAYAEKIKDVYGLYTVDTSGRRIFVNDIEFADHNGDGVIFDFFKNANRTNFDSESDIYKEIISQVKDAKI